MQAHLAMEKHPDFVVIKADIKNFYNEGDRDKALQEHADGVRQGNIDLTGLQAALPMSAQESPIFGNNGQRMGFTSSMGGQQGCDVVKDTVPTLASIDGRDRRTDKGCRWSCWWRHGRRAAVCRQTGQWR
jgi:hypothetical protein